MSFSHIKLHLICPKTNIFSVFTFFVLFSKSFIYLQKNKNMKKEQLEVMQLRVAFNERGIKHIWDFMQAFYPNKFDREEFRGHLSGNKINNEMTVAMQEILKKITN